MGNKKKKCFTVINTDTLINPKKKFLIFLVITKKKKENKA